MIKTKIINQQDFDKLRNYFTATNLFAFVRLNSLAKAFAKEGISVTEQKANSLNYSDSGK